MTLKEIKNLAVALHATDVTHWTSKQCYAICTNRIASSAGVYGINAAVYQDLRDPGKFYVCLGRVSALYYLS